MATVLRRSDASSLSQPAPQQGQTQPDHIRKTALNPLHQRTATPLQCKAASALQRFSSGYVGLDLGGAQWRELHAGGDGGEAFRRRISMDIRSWTLPRRDKPDSVSPTPFTRILNKGRLSRFLLLRVY
jgi:hypothetical protein